MIQVCNGVYFYYLLQSIHYLLPEHHRVQISPGVTTGELLKFFMEKNICIKADVIAQNFTYGGLLATGSHVSLPLVYGYLRCIFSEASVISL